METPANTAVKPATASGPKAPSGKPSAPAAPSSTALASGQVKQLALAESPTELQRGIEAFDDVFANLVGGQPDTDNEPQLPEEPKPRAEKKTKPNTEDSPPAPKAKAKASDVIAPADEEEEDTPDPDGSVLPDETPAAAEEDDEEDGDEGSDRLQAKLFKLRETKRTLKAALKEAETAKEELNTKLKSLQEASPTLAFDGAYANVKAAEDIQAVETWLGSYEAKLEDFLEDNMEDTFMDETSGQPVERDRKSVRERLRAVRAELKRAPQIHQAFKATQTRMEESTALAKKRYPFVFDTNSKFNDVVLETARDYPELAHSPGRSLALGRLAVAKLVESGKFRLVPVTKAAAKPATTAEPAPARKPASLPSPPPPRRASVSREDRPEESDRYTQRLIGGDPRAVEDFAASLLGS